MKPVVVDCLHCSERQQLQVIKIWGRGILFHGLFVFLPFDVAKHLCVPQELAEVNVEHVSAGLQHDVVIVAVTDS